MKLPRPSDLDLPKLAFKTLKSWLIDNPQGGEWVVTPDMPDEILEQFAKSLNDEYWEVTISHGTDYWGDVRGAHGLPAGESLHVKRK